VAYQDKTLTCVECGQHFTFTAGEQEFYVQHNLLNEPKRCPTCRQNRRASRNNSGQRELFPATCANCGKEAMVPFRPRGDRPVYCSDCYSRMGTASRQA
jgi:CxxC-x17-CxxC domain-containing protein